MLKLQQKTILNNKVTPEWEIYTTSEEIVATKGINFWHFTPIYEEFTDPDS